MAHSANQRASLTDARSRRSPPVPRSGLLVGFGVLLVARAPVASYTVDALGSGLLGLGAVFWDTPGPASGRFFVVLRSSPFCVYGVFRALCQKRSVPDKKFDLNQSRSD